MNFGLTSLQVHDTMQEPTIQELNEAIEALTDYRERLRKEITTISQKLHMPQKKIESTLKEHSELQKVESTLQNLKDQKKTLI